MERVFTPTFLKTFQSCAFLISVNTQLTESLGLSCLVSLTAEGISEGLVSGVGLGDCVLAHWKSKPTLLQNVLKSWNGVDISWENS